MNTKPFNAQREPELLGQTAVVIAGTTGIGLDRRDGPAPKEPTLSSLHGTASASRAPRKNSARPEVRPSSDEHGFEIWNQEAYSFSVLINAESAAGC